MRTLGYTVTQAERVKHRLDRAMAKIEDDVAALRVIVPEYEAVVSLTFQTTAFDAWKCLERSGFFGGALFGETMVESIELHGPDEADV